MNPARFVRTLDALSPLWRLSLLALIVVVGILVRLRLFDVAVYVGDITYFVKWLETALTSPPNRLYARETTLNYPAAYAFILELTAWGYRALPHANHDVPLMRAMLQLPAIAADLVGAVVAYAIVKRFAAPSYALMSAAFFALNPAIMYVSAYWGQIDSVPTTAALAAVLLLLSGAATLAWPVLAFAVLIKPPVFILVPMFAIYPFMSSNKGELKRRLLGLVFGVVLAGALTEALAFMFFPHSRPLDPTRLLLSQIHSGSSLYTKNSLNAFNFWAIFQYFFLSDETHWGPLTMKRWAMALFIAIAALIFLGYTRRRSATAFLEGAFLLFLAFFLFMPEMHERYLTYAVMFAGVLVFRRPYAIAAAALTVTMVLNLEYAWTYMYLVHARVTAVNVYQFAPMLIRICALANVGIFVWLAAPYLSPFIQSLFNVARAGRHNPPKSGVPRSAPQV